MLVRKLSARFPCRLIWGSHGAGRTFVAVNPNLDEMFSFRFRHRLGTARPHRGFARLESADYVRPWVTFLAGESVVPRGEVDGLGGGGEAAGSLDPSCDRLGCRPNFHTGSAGRICGVPPMDGEQSPAFPEHACCLSQQSSGFLAVEDIEEEAGILRVVWHVEAVREDVAEGCVEVVELCFGGPRLSSGDHRRVDIEGAKSSRNPPSGGNREGAEAAAEFDDISRLRIHPKFLQDTVGIQEAFPEGLVGHAAFAQFH